MRAPARLQLPNRPVYLRPLEPGDAGRVAQWHADPAFFETTVADRPPMYPGGTKRWLEEHLAAEDELNMAICLEDGDVHIGNLYLRDIDLEHRRAEFHILIGDRGHRRLHTGTAWRTILKYAFGELGLNRLYAYALAGTVFAEAPRFWHLDGRLREHVVKNGEYRDVVVLSVLAEDYAARPDLQDDP